MLPVIQSLVILHKTSQIVNATGQGHNTVLKKLNETTQIILILQQVQGKRNGQKCGE